MQTSHRLTRETPIERTPRVLQLESMFDVPDNTISQREWTIDLPLDDAWQIGVIVGPSGAGKTSVAEALFGQKIVRAFDWPETRSIVDAFPPSMGIKEITGLLSSVGFSSPPSWLRPFHALSNGEQFRVHLARALAEKQDILVVDEFTSVVDRTVAQIGSAAVARVVRESGRKLIAVTCHYDVIDWLDPDWIYEPHTNHFQRRLVRQRPPIDIRVSRVDPSAWKLFRHHHYLDHNLHKAAICLGAFWKGRPVGFASVITFPHPTRAGWRAHRIVCLPDFQGVGIGTRLSELVASAFTATGKPYFLTSGHPAILGHMKRSPHWRIAMKPRLNRRWGEEKEGTVVERNRLITTFEYIGPQNEAAARTFGIL